MNLKSKALMIGIGIFVSILISGCVEEPRQTGDSVNISSSAPFFPTQNNPDPVPECMNAELVGELVLVDGCLRVDEYLLVWPYGFSLSTEGEVIQIIDDTGQPIVRVGDKIKVGGGESPCEYDRCPGPCWIVCKYDITSG